jgi:hypothetical protein
MSDQDGLTQQDFEDLIRRLSQRKQESPRDRIPFQDVKDILQDEGLLESLLKEHVNGSNNFLKESEQRHRKQKSLLTKGFAVISVVLAGLSAWGGYTMGHQMNVGITEQSVEKLNSQIQSLETKIANSEQQSQEYQNQLKEKDTQIKDLISKVSTSKSTIESVPADSSNPGLAENTIIDFDSIIVGLPTCKRSGKSIMCSLNIVSKVDQPVGFGSCSRETKTRFFDTQGIEHKASATQFGSQFDNSGCTVSTNLIKEVPVKAVLTFTDIPLEIKKLKALELSVSVKGENDTKWEYPQYRDIAIR